MIQSVLTHIGGISGYGVGSLCLFLALFLGIVIWMLRLKRAYLDSMRTLPLEEEAMADAEDRFSSHSDPFHEPPLTPSLSASDGERVSRGRRMGEGDPARFMDARHAHERKAAPHE